MIFEVILAGLFTLVTGVILRSRYKETQYKKWLSDRNIY